MLNNLNERCCRSVSPKTVWIVPNIFLNFRSDTIKNKIIININIYNSYKS